MKEILNLYKRPGETPLECLERFRAVYPEYRNEKMTYAGRLDPLADGVLIALAGEARFRKEELLALAKTYEFEVLWGISSDTHDVLGIAELHDPDRLRADGEVEISRKIRGMISRFTGIIEQAYPLYSSRTIAGTPLFALARNGVMQADEFPRRKVTIHSLELLGTYTIDAGALLGKALQKISSVKGDFRQSEAAVSWKKALCERAAAEIFSVSSFRATVSSGTYVRALAEAMGRALGSRAIAWKITRTSVGSHLLANSI